MKKRSSFGSMLSCLLLSAGCSAGKTQPVVPPQILAPCDEPVWEGKTNGDLVEYVGELKEALGRCNADKEAIAKILK